MTGICCALLAGGCVAQEGTYYNAAGSNAQGEGLQHDEPTGPAGIKVNTVLECAYGLRPSACAVPVFHVGHILHTAACGVRLAWVHGVL